MSSLGDGDATSIGWINEKDAPKHPSPKTKDELNPNVKGDKVEKLCFSYKLSRAFERLFPDVLRPEQMGLLPANPLPSCRVGVNQKHCDGEGSDKARGKTGRT